MSKPANRLLTLILLLQRKPNQKAAELAASLGVSVRTLHRYIEMLDEMGIPVYTGRGPYGGFSLVRGYKMPPLVFTPEEAVAVIVDLHDHNAIEILAFESRTLPIIFSLHVEAPWIFIPCTCDPHKKLLLDASTCRSRFGTGEALAG